MNLASITESELPKLVVIKIPIYCLSHDIPTVLSSNSYSIAHNSFMYATVPDSLSPVVLVVYVGTVLVVWVLY